MSYLRLLPAALFLGLTGCVPVNVVWDADSAGFVFARPDEQKTRLVGYSLARKARTDLALVDCSSPWPAAGPEGRLALARATVCREGPGTIQFVIVERSGKVVRESTEFKVGLADKDLAEASQRAPAFVLAWTANPERIVWAHPLARTCGVYEPARDRTVETTNAMPLLAGSGSPVRPDGRGFLAVTPFDLNGPACRKEGEPEPGLALIGWDGKADRLGVPFSLTAEQQAASPGPVSLRFAGAELLATSIRGTAAFSLDRRFERADEKALPDFLSSADRPLIWHHALPDGACLCFFGEGAGRASLEFQKPAHKLRRVVSETKSSGILIPSLAVFPSPDGRKVAVRRSDDTEILVLDTADGSTLAVVAAEG
jgi:hypothetical protein